MIQILYDTDPTDLSLSLFGYHSLPHIHGNLDFIKALYTMLCLHLSREGQSIFMVEVFLVYQTHRVSLDIPLLVIITILSTHLHREITGFPEN